MQNQNFIQVFSAPTDCIGSRNTSGQVTDPEVTIHDKNTAVSNRPSGHAQTNSAQKRWEPNFSFKNFNNRKGVKMPSP